MANVTLIYSPGLSVFNIFEFEILLVGKNFNLNSWINFSQLLGNVALVEFFHEILVFLLVVVSEFSIINHEAVLIQRDFADMAVFAFLFLGELVWSSK